MEKIGSAVSKHSENLKGFGFSAKDLAENPKKWRGLNPRTPSFLDVCQYEDNRDCWRERCPMVNSSHSLQFQLGISPAGRLKSELPEKGEQRLRVVTACNCNWDPKRSRDAPPSLFNCVTFERWRLLCHNWTITLQTKFLTKCTQTTLPDRGKTLPA